MKHAWQCCAILVALPTNAEKISISFEGTTDDERGVLHWYGVTYELGGKVGKLRVEQVVTVNEASGTANTHSHWQVPLTSTAAQGGA